MLAYHKSAFLSQEIMNIAYLEYFIGCIMAYPRCGLNYSLIIGLSYALIHS